VTTEHIPMNIQLRSTPARSIRSGALLAAVVATLLAACNQSPPPTAPPAATATHPADTAPQTVLGKSVAAALRKAREELETSNIDLDKGVDVRTGTNGHHFRIGHATNGSNAQITPKGDLLIDGKAVPVTPAQRALVLEYRRGILDIAEAGMNIGVKGADLAGKAVLETFSGLMHGNPDQAGKRIEAEGRRLETDAKQICGRLPALLDSQQRLAASLPAFEPYATMTQDDIEDCMKDDGASVTTAERAEIRDEIRNRIREGIRGSVQRAAPHDTPASTTDESKEASEAR
jgi:hypothetical protein